MSHGLVSRPNDIPLLGANQSQAKLKSAVGGNLLQSWVNLTIVGIWSREGKRGVGSRLSHP